MRNLLFCLFFFFALNLDSQCTTFDFESIQQPTTYYVNAAFHFVDGGFGNFSPDGDGDLNGTTNIQNLIYHANASLSNPEDNPVYDFSSPDDMHWRIQAHTTLEESIHYWDSIEEYIPVPGVLNIRFVDGQTLDADGNFLLFQNGGFVDNDNEIEINGWQSSRIFADDPTYTDIHPFPFNSWDYGRTVNHEISHLFGLEHWFDPTDPCIGVDMTVEAESSGDSNNTMTYGEECQCSWTPCQWNVMYSHLLNQNTPWIDGDCGDIIGQDRVIDSQVLFDEIAYIFGDLIIESGGVLTITCATFFSKNSHLVVKRGGKLRVVGGVLNNMPCDAQSKWKGIFVEGNGVDQPDPFQPSGSNDAGVVLLTANARIVNAKTGITCNKKGEDWNSDYYGGRIHANQAVFNHCNKGIALYPMQNDRSQLTSVSIIDGKTGISLWDNHGLTIENTTISHNNIAVYGINSTIEVTENSDVNNNALGVGLIYTHIPVEGVNYIGSEISDFGNSFRNNDSWDILLSGAGHQNLIQNNSFSDANYGIYMNGYNNYTIVDNTFTGHNDACTFYSTATFNSTVDQYNYINENDFNNNTRSMILAFDNSTVGFDGNCFSDSEEIDIYLRKGQIINNIGTPSLSANNCFSENINGALDIYAEGMQPFRYWFAPDFVFFTEPCLFSQDLNENFKRKASDHIDPDCGTFEIVGEEQPDYCQFELGVTNIDSLLNVLEEGILEIEEDTIESLENALWLSRYNLCLKKLLQVYADSLIKEGDCLTAFELYDRQLNEEIRIKAFSVLLECKQCDDAREWLTNFISDNPEILDYISIQQINVKRICDHRNYSPREEELSTLYDIAHLTHPYAAFARSLWRHYTGEYIIPHIPDIRIDGDVESRENQLVESIRIYPNPANTKVFVQNLNNGIKSHDIVISDLYGRCIKEFVANNTLEHIDIAQVPEGIYFITIFSEGGIEHKEKIIIER